MTREINFVSHTQTIVDVIYI